MSTRRTSRVRQPAPAAVIVGVSIICLIGILAVPNFTHPRVTAAPMSCVAQLRMIDGMKNQWALDYHKTTNDVPTWDDLQPYWKARLPLECPEGGVYSIGRIGEMASCSFARHKENERTNSP